MIIDQPTSRPQLKARIRGVFFILTIISLIPTTAWLAWINLAPDTLSTIHQEPNNVVKLLTIAGAVILALVVLLIITILAAAIAGGIALAIAALGWAIGIYTNARTTDHSQQGLLPIREIDITPWYLKLFGVKWISTTDPNRQIPAVGVTRYWPWGAVTTTGANYGADLADQLEYNSQVLSVRQAAAGKKSASKWEVLAQHNLLPQQQPVAALPDTQAPVSNPQSPALTLSRALNTSTVDSLILGATDQNQPCRINLRSAVHLAIVGASGCGKTVSSGYQLALAALKTGYRTIILDPKGGMDWAPFAHVAEYHPTNATLIADQFAPIYAEYQRRMDLAARHQVSHIAHLNQTDIPPLLFLLEEYGDLCRELRRLRRTADIDRIDSWIDTIATKGRAADIHIALIDQYPDQWSQQTLMATKAKIVYQVGPGQGNKVGEWHAERLPDNGRFLHRQTEYNAWHVAPHLPTLLSALPAHRYPPLLATSATPPADVEEQEYPTFVADGVGVSTSGTNATNAPMNAATNDSTNDPAGKWDDIARAWITANPSAPQADLARHMASLDGRPTEYENYRSIAHQMWHAHHPQGRNYTQSPTTNHQSPTTDLFGNSVEVLDLNNPDHAAEIAALRAQIQNGNITIKGRST